MKLNRHICIVLTILLLTLSMAGCAQDTKLAAKVGDEEITVSYLENMLAGNSALASSYGYDMTTAEGIDGFVEVLLNEAIASDAKIYQAKLAGITLTDEEAAEAAETGKKAYDDLFQQYVDAATQNGATDPNAQALTYFTDSLASSHTTVSQLKKDLVEDAENDLLVEKHKEALLADAELTDEEIKAMYDEELADQTGTFELDPSMYFTYEAYYLYGYTAMPLTVPEGFFYVRQILVEEVKTANELYERIQGGEDFETLLAEYNTDPGMEREEYAKGYLVGKGANYDEAFLNAALALEKAGDVSEPVKSDYGWHIVKRMEDRTPGPISYDEIKAAFREYAIAKHESEYYNGLVNEWVAGDYVTRYPENISDISKTLLNG